MTSVNKCYTNIWYFKVWVIHISLTYFYIVYIRTPFFYISYVIRWLFKWIYFFETLSQHSCSITSTRAYFYTTVHFSISKNSKHIFFEFSWCCFTPLIFMHNSIKKIILIIVIFYKPPSLRHHFSSLIFWYAIKNPIVTIFNKERCRIFI